MGVLDKKSLLKALELKKETVVIEGGEVIVTEITATEYMDVYESPGAKNDKGEFDGVKFSALLAARCIVDAKGNRLFADEEADLLRNGSSSVFSKISAVVKRLNGLAGDEAKN